MSNKWKLKRTRQCAKCPWRIDVNPQEIPNGYCETKHKGLESTIADQNNPYESIGDNKAAMACHETDDAHCVGWLVNQLGEGNNIGLRIQMMSCENRSEIKLVGDQWRNFEDTLPQKYCANCECEIEKGQEINAGRPFCSAECIGDFNDF